MIMVTAITFFWSNMANPAIPFMINITHLRIKPLTLTNDHGRYIHDRYTRTDTCVRWG
jgi:hypothetical protein